MHNKAIKSTTKTQLNNNWSKAYAAIAIALMASLCIFLAEQLITELLANYGIISSSAINEESVSDLGDLSLSVIRRIISDDFLYAQIIAFFFILIRFLVISPLTQGHTKWYYSIAKGTKPYLSKMFAYYQSNESYISILYLRFNLTLRSVMYGVVSFLAAAASLSLSIYQFSIYSLSELASDRQKAILYLAVTGFLLLLGAVLYALLMLKFFLVTYLFADIKKFDGGFRQVNACFSKSKELMKGETARVISLVISFIPAMLSCVLILPILYVYPYMRCSLAVLANDIIRSEKEKNEN